MIHFLYDRQLWTTSFPGRELDLRIGIFNIEIVYLQNGNLGWTRRNEMDKWFGIYIEKGK